MLTPRLGNMKAHLHISLACVANNFSTARADNKALAKISGGSNGDKVWITTKDLTTGRVCNIISSSLLSRL